MRYALFFALACGAGLYGTASLTGAWRWLLIWPALSCGLHALAYLLGRPELLGKQPDGRLAGWARLLHLPYFALIHSLWLLQVALSREPANDEVAPGVWVGRRPWPQDLPPDCELVVDLTCEFGRHPGVVAQTEYLSLPTLDGTAPSADALRRVAALAARRGPILIHCAAGHGRSATAAAALLLARGLVQDVDEAEARLRAARPGIRLNRSQRTALTGTL